MTNEWVIEWIEIEKLRPNPKNPYKHSEEDIAETAKIIKFQGWRHPIICDKDLLIWAGHKRLSAAKVLKLKKVPVHIQKFDSYEQAYSFLTSDNELGKRSDIEIGMVKVDLVDLASGFDLSLLAIKDLGLDLSQPDFEPGTEEEQGQLDQKALVFMECPHCGKQFEQQQARKIEA